MKHDRPGKRLGELVKLRFTIEEGIETTWAELKGPGLYEVANVPYYVYDVSYGDLVSAEASDTERVYNFGRVHQRSGHSTYRLLQREAASRDQFQFGWKGLEALGCRYESTGRLYAVDVPVAADIYRVYEYLEAGEKKGLWDFEEGHCGHALRT
jgi:hypothetical protein